MNIHQELTASLGTGFINHLIQSDKVYRPELLTNDHKQGKKVLTTILHELRTCDEFWFSVAFITTSGVATLMNTLIELDKKNVRGKILASQYLNFTQPEALIRIKQFKNIELKIATKGDFHSKGYLFKKDGIYDLIIGSSNLTQTALCSNKEWNLKISATDNSELIFQAVKEFKKEFEAGSEVTADYLQMYRLLWRNQLDYQKKVNQIRHIAPKIKVVPNQMQEEALSNLAQLRSKGETKALLISATGTGKTYLSAFDVQSFKPKKFLFLVHRRNIAEKAMQTFLDLLGPDIKAGIFSGNKRELESDYLFSTVQTISRQDNLEQFSADYFDYIVIDETHRANADSYLRVIAHFKPQFMLGMTATPERTDGADVFKLFDHNIAYEIRLHAALAENMLSPFHYYGVTDLTVNNEEVNDKTEFNKLCAAERVDHIIENAEKYGCDDGEVRGLIFCSKIDIASELSAAFNKKGYVTKALSSLSSEADRQEAIRRLESASKSEKLDYIFTVDIFNEGIDIPKVNQIILLRPTESAIIFVQQLGRGLRKTDGKEYLTVIDFIGNYSNNYMLPIALYGDNSYNKDSLRKLMASGSSLLPGESTINFDRIAKERIFDALNKVNMSKLLDLKKDYFDLKNKIGRIPTMVDFLERGSRDPWLYVKYKKSYLNFVILVEKDFKHSLHVEDLRLLENFSLEINNGKRVEESLILLHLIKHGRLKTSQLKSEVQERFEYSLSDETIESCVFNLNFHFVKLDYKVVKINKQLLEIDEELSKVISNPVFEQFLLDSVYYSIQLFTREFDKDKFVDGFLRYSKYRRKDVCRILNWQKNEEGVINGYKTINKLTPCFVTYQKSDSISANINYNDHFIDQGNFAWESRHQRKLKSPEIQKVIDSNRILLFVKKRDDEGKDFYYIGDCTIAEDGINQSIVPSTGVPIVHFKFLLDKPIEDNLYRYFEDV